MQIHHRHSIRLKRHDYTSNGMYFITICIHNHHCLFGNIENRKMQPNPFGQIARDQWYELPNRFPDLELDAFVVMPNHVHGILILDDTVSSGLIETNVGAGFTPALVPESGRATARVAPTSVSKIIGMYKSLVLHHAIQYIKSNCPDMLLGKLWQRGFYDHIVRDHRSYEKIANYIINNPTNWHNDKFYGRTIN